MMPNLMRMCCKFAMLYVKWNIKKVLIILYSTIPSNSLRVFMWIPHTHTFQHSESHGLSHMEVAWNSRTRGTGYWTPASDSYHGSFNSSQQLQFEYPLLVQWQSDMPTVSDGFTLSPCILGSLPNLSCRQKSRKWVIFWQRHFGLNDIQVIDMGEPGTPGPSWESWVILIAILRNTSTYI